MLATLCLAVAAGLALIRLLARDPARQRRGSRRSLALTIVRGLARRAIRWSPPRRHFTCRRSTRADVAVVELPLGGVAEDTLAMYHSIAHQRPAV